MLDMRRLRIFEAVATTGSFQSAAQELSYTGPAISHHIAKLEQEVGAKLISRRGPGPNLTAAGELLLGRSRAILASVADTERALAELAGRGTVVRVGAFATASASFVTEAIVELGREQPGITISLVDGEPDETIERLHRREIDIGLAFDSAESTLAEADDQLDLDYLGDDPLVLAMAADHPLATQPALGIGDFADEAWIEGARGDSQISLILQAACARACFEPRIAFNSGNIQVMLRMVAARVGVALIPRIALHGDQQGLAVRELDEPRPARRIVLVMRRSGERSQPLEAVAATLRAQAGDWLDHPSHRRGLASVTSAS
ncbi:MAG TPA: LysR family transcriptional regulator [Solirubrobacterales bacterium]